MKATPQLYAVLEATVASLLFLCLLFIPMEKIFPAKKQKIVRHGWLLDLCFFLGQYLLWSGLVIWALDHFSQFLTSTVPVSFQQMVARQPFFIQLIEVILLSDFLVYWGHRLQHSVDFLWRFHKVHHSAQQLDWLAAHREHPLDSIYTIGLINLPAFVMGFPLESIAGVIAFRGIWAVFIHSNVRLPLGPFRVLIGSPELHHWHHALDRSAGNYANVSPIMDIIFGTYTCPDVEPDHFGVNGETPKSYIGQLVEPVLPRRAWMWIKTFCRVFCRLHFRARSLMARDRHRERAH